MHGFFHLLLEAYVSDSMGAQHLPQIRQRAGMPGLPLASQHYPDQATAKLLQAIAEYQSVPLDDLLYHFGVYFLNAPLMRHHYGAFLETHASARSFLEQVPAIHRYLERSLQDVKLPELHCIQHDPGLLEISYASPRRLCRFLQGILAGVGQQFNEPLEIRELECQHNGAPACRMLVRFLPARRSGPMLRHPSLAGAGASGARALPDTLPFQPLAPGEKPGETEARRQREEEEDLLILQALSAEQASISRPFKAGSVSKRSEDAMLSLFEIARWLTATGAPAEYTRLSLMQRALTRLAGQGLIEAKLNPQATRQHTSAGVAGLGGEGILAAQRYRITPAGQAWLSELELQRQGGR
jgi:hypothetical protein